MENRHLDEYEFDEDSVHTHTIQKKSKFKTKPACVSVFGVFFLSLKILFIVAKSLP